MKTVMFLTLLGLFLHDTTAVTHSLQYFYTASIEVPNFPEFVAVGMVDELQIDCYDSNIKKDVPKQEWFKKFTESVPNYLAVETGKQQGHQQTFKGNIDIAKQRFNQTGGVHIAQEMYGCEWDDETGEVNGYFQDGYDGEDFIALDMKTMTWVAPIPQAVITKHKWDQNKARLDYLKNYLTKECVDWLKKYVDYGKSSLMRTDLPTVSLLQKSPSSRITCHATGFYPNRAVMFWRKDGEELQENVDHGEILPNPDGSFQMSADLELPSRDWEKYECVFQLAGVKEDIVTRLEKREIKTNHVDPINMIIRIIAGVLIGAVILAGVGYWIYKKRAPIRPPSSVSDSGVEQQMLEKPSP
ncbi:major histocompatibility complex class I-related gene protein-like [Cheilinus undulatus]|uniref:major histocompatibility complex class I-related gene protein-like n=1 Tax=Cheilinus undulatus TaxID=241271 RepID=UPI001BD5C4C5|nr:major histocompatibility complex class I-related gene protein-like [Cheilinus undulatus]